MKKIISIFGLMALILVISMCKKEPELPAMGNKIDQGGNVIDSVGYRDATIKSTAEGLGNNKVTQHGHCWGQQENPTNTGNCTTLGQLLGTATFSSHMTNLNPATKYYIRSYYITDYQTVYGDQVVITTRKTGKPYVTTAKVSNFTAYSAACGGNVVSDSGLAVTIRGICWDRDSTFTVDSCLGKSTIGNGLGSYSLTMIALAESANYWVKAFAVNQAGTSYGLRMPFTTLTVVPPTVTTSTVTYVTAHSAVCVGNVANSGNGTVTHRGVCWDTGGNPTLGNSLGHLFSGSGTGSFSITLTGLERKQEYFVAAFAINEKDTAYGAILSFETKCDTPTVATGSFHDITSKSLIMFDNRVDDEGGCSVTLRGVCWSKTFDKPTLQNCDGHAENGMGLGTYSDTVTGLSPDTWYWVTAYALNEDATNYGIAKYGQTQGPCEGMNTLTITHYAGSVAPVDKWIPYGLRETDLSGSNKCWITQNLGASHQATSVSDATEASAGWYWQFNRMQGYKHDGTTLTPSTTWIYPIDEDFDWLIANDPCALLLGTGWRLPTATEWTNVEAGGGWTNWNGPWNSALKMHAAGYLSGSDLHSRGSYGTYWSSSQYGNWNGWNLDFLSDDCYMSCDDKAGGFSGRCLRD